MSSQLLFTASSQKQFGDWGTGIEGDADTKTMGIEDPNNYKNDLRNTIKIPKHSEIAVVNCEINRGISYCLDIEDRFYWWYDELLTNLNENEVGCLPFPILMSQVLTRDEEGHGKYDGLDVCNLTGTKYAELIQEAMRACICMPQFWRTATCEIDPASDGRKLKFSITSHGNQKSTNMAMRIPDYTADPPIQSYFGLYQQNKATVNWDLDWTATTGKGLAGDTLTRAKATSVFTGAAGARGVIKPDGDWDDNCRVINRTAPLSVVEGSMIVELTNALNGFEVGLTRPQTYDTYNEAGDFDPITNFDGDDPDNYLPNQCDYVVKYWDEGNAGTRKIHFYQLMRDVPVAELDLDGPEGVSRMIEVTYWGNTAGSRPASQITETNMGAAGNKFNFLKFEIKGEGIEVTLGDKVDFSGTNAIIVTSFSTTGDVTQHPLPIGMNTWAVYPLFSLGAQNDNLIISQFSNDDPNGLNWMEVASNRYNYILDSADQCNTYAITGWDDDDEGDRPFVNGTSFFGWALSETAESDDDWGVAGTVGWMYEFLKCRNPNFNGMNGLVATFGNRYKYLDTDSEAPNLVHGIITEKGQWGDGWFETDGVYSTPPDWNPNMSRALGVLYRNLFQTVDGVTSNIAGTKVTIDYRGKWVVTASDDFGNEPDIMLIEVLPFNHQSYNLCRNVPSKMVYVVPKSDYRGRVDGKMFHEAHDRYYVSLNNPGDIYVNQLEVRFTNKNGQTTTDLVGCSVVTFHIQPERGRVIEDKQREGPFGGA